jgi:hypothetical protein
MPSAPRTQLSFYLVVPETKSAVHSIRAFTEWILQECRVPTARVAGIRAGAAVGSSQSRQTRYSGKS